MLSFSFYSTNTSYLLCPLSYSPLLRLPPLLLLFSPTSSSPPLPPLSTLPSLSPLPSLSLLFSPSLPPLLLPSSALPSLSPSPPPLSYSSSPTLPPLLSPPILQLGSKGIPVWLLLALESLNSISRYFQHKNQINEERRREGKRERERG